jgi:hypothetical protein
MEQPENTMIERPQLFVPDGMKFIHVLRKAMQEARKHGIDEVAMVRDIQSHNDIKDRMNKLHIYFEVV